MIPEPTEDGYEGFDVLAEKTNSWLANQPPSITVTNMQSVMAMLSEGKLDAYLLSKPLHDKFLTFTLKLRKLRNIIACDLSEVYAY